MSTVGENKIPTFNGKTEKFLVWWTKFQAYANRHGFAEALKDGYNSELPGKASEVLDESVPAEKA